MTDDALIIRMPLDSPTVRKPSTRTEIVRSFSMKKNLGNYESADFFMSQKAECDIEDAERVSDAVYAFCRKQVLKAVAEFKKERE